MREPAADSPTAPFAVRLGLIALLPALALALYVDGQHYDPDLVALKPRQSGALVIPGLFPNTLAGLQPSGQLRVFDKDNLYEYINGHAEYFLGAGFRALAVGEYGDAGDGEPALVVNLYDMGEPLSAFGVLVDEAGDQETVDVGAMGFRSGQGLSFIHGPFYVQMRLFDEALSATKAGAELAQGLAELRDDSGLSFEFPDLGAVTSTRFVKEDYRGLEFLDEVLERGFVRNGEEIQAFLVQDSEEEIAKLVAAFEAFFQEDGIAFQRLDRNGLGFYRIDDPYEGEWFFVPLGDVLVGVYTALEEELIRAIGDFTGGKP